MHIEVVLALFTLMLTAIGVFFLSQRIRVPYTVLLVIVGSVLVPVSRIDAFSFLTSFHLTPELLFFVFLPILIFESAYNMNIRKMGESAWSISLLSVVSLLLSTAFVALGIFYGFKLVHFDIPFIVALIFGALISATDPVAVLALFKEYGAPRRLALIFEGESLFNDGTSLAVFLIVLEVMVSGFDGVSSIVEGVFLFSTMIVGGILMGLLVGVVFAKLIERVRDNENVEITLTMLVAHFTFILTELVSEHLVVLGHEVKFSAIIATVVASMLIGNYGRYKISPRVEEYMEKFWGYFAFLANSLVFILMGLLFAEQHIDLRVFILPMLTAILVVAIGRAFSVYPVVALVNWLGKEERIPLSWQHLMAWGSLRGALAVTMVLLIPDDVVVPGWQHDFTVKEFVAAVTIGCIYFTLLVKATTVGPIMKRLRLNHLTPYENVEYYESKALVYAKTLLRLAEFSRKGYIDDALHKKLKDRYESLYNASCRGCDGAVCDGSGLAEGVLRMHAIGIEKHALRELFLYGEITERVYKQVLNKLDVQLGRVEHGITQLNSPDEVFKSDVFERLAQTVRKAIGKKKDERVNRYMYYRAQAIIARKVVRSLKELSEHGGMVLFRDVEVLDKVTDLYTHLYENAKNKMSMCAEKDGDVLRKMDEEFVIRGLFKTKESIVEDLYRKEMITPKLRIMLYEELEGER